MQGKQPTAFVQAAGVLDDDYNPWKLSNILYMHI